MIIYKLFLKYIFIFCVLLIPFSPKANEHILSQNNDGSGNDGIHAETWAFGHSPDREEAIWAKGQTGKSLLSKKRKKVVSETEIAKDETQNDKRRIRSALDLSVKEESGSWKVTPSQKDIRPDENRVRENKHILGAYAGVEAGNDFNIKVGPELILKDDSHGDESAYTDQPDSAFGLGMKFKYDF